jgi:hypothetical protein
MLAPHYFLAMQNSNSTPLASFPFAAWCAAFLHPLRQCSALGRISVFLFRPAGCKPWE